MAVGNYVMVFFMWTFIALLAGLLLIGMLFFFLWLYRLLKYKVEVHLYEKVGSAYQLRKDVACEVLGQDMSTNKRRTYLLLRKGFKGLKKLPLPQSSEYIAAGMRKHINLLFKDGLLSPLPILESNDPTLSWKPEHLLRVLDSWDADYSENLETHKMGQSFWDKWGVSINFWILIVMQFILFLILIMQLKGGQGGQLPDITQLIK